MSILKANTNKPWMAPEYDIPVLENEEMWSQRVIDEEQRRQRERNEIVTKIDT